MTARPGDHCTCVDCSEAAQRARQIAAIENVEQQKFDDDCPDEGSGAGASRGWCWASIASLRRGSGIRAMMSGSMHAHGVRSPVASAAGLLSGQRCTGTAAPASRSLLMEHDTATHMAEGDR